MTEWHWPAAFLMGLAGSLHCVSMCGGIAAALRFASPKEADPLPYMLVYNLGRILSYTLLGGLAGAISHTLVRLLPVFQPLLLFAAGIMIVLLAAYLGRWSSSLLFVEKLGTGVWKHLQPLAKRWIPFSSVWSALPYGMIWGWLPCGLVYSALSWSLASGSAVAGASIMFAFGMGTFPTLVATGMGTQLLVNLLKKAYVRQGIAICLFMYGVFLIYQSIGSIKYS